MTFNPDIVIGDLIDIPNVPSVIDTSIIRDLEPEDSDSQKYLKELANFFYVTEDINAILSQILHSVIKKSGKGFFITGNYGSGKSYLLTIISLIVKHDWARNIIQKNCSKFNLAFNSLKTIKILPVNIPLTEFQGDSPLEEIVWESIEKVAISENIPLSMSYCSRFLNLFQKYIKPVHENEIELFFRNYSDEEITWDKFIYENPTRLYTLCQKFLKFSKINIPFRVTTNRKQLLDELDYSLHGAKWDGIIILLDEISEFLQSKPDANSLSEDVRFLQFLGEKSAYFPIWIVGTLQDSIERTVKIHDQVFKKIKARYHYKLRLGSYHIKEIISSRLIKPKKGAVRHIEEVFYFIKNSFEDIKFSLDEFQKLYPIHPETISLLDKNADLFSRKRGVVDFIITQVRGNPELGIHGILNKSKETLLTPDKIFDHFQDRLAESPDYSIYFKLYYEHFEPLIAKHFEDAFERQLALQTIKLLIILDICPWKEKRTVKAIANMLFPSLLGPYHISKELIYELYNEKILKRLAFNIGNIKYIEASNILDSVYSIDIGINPLKSISVQLSNIASKVHPISKEVLKSVYSKMNYGILPCATFFHKACLRRDILWQGTYRKIVVYLSDINEIPSELLNRCRLNLENNSIHLCIFIGTLSEDYSQKKLSQLLLMKEKHITQSGLIFWLPEKVEDQMYLRLLSEFYACMTLQKSILSSSIETHNTFMPLLDERIKKITPLVYDKVLIYYIKGTLLSSLGENSVPFDRKIDNFDHWLQLIIEPFLLHRYPEHKKYAPSKFISGKIILSKIIHEVIIPGKLSRKDIGSDLILRDILQHSLIPLGFIKCEKNHCYLSASAKYCPSVAIVLKALAEQYSPDIQNSTSLIPVEKLYKSLSSPPFGMAESIFIITVCTLFRKGFITLLNSNHKQIQLKAFNPDRLRSYFIKRAFILPSKYRPIFFEVYRLLFKRKPKAFSVDIQDQLWKKIQDNIKTWSHLLKQVPPFLNTLNICIEGKPVNFPRIDDLINKLERLENRVNEDVHVVKGLISFFDALSMTGDFEIFKTNLDKIVDFFNSKKNDLVKMIDYVNDTRLKIPQDQKYSLLQYLYENLKNELHISDEFILETQLEKCTNLFSQFQTEYIKIYSKEHSERNYWLYSDLEKKYFRTEHLNFFKKLLKMKYFSNKILMNDIDYFFNLLSNTPCGMSPFEILKNHPVCYCQYQLGQKAVESRQAYQLQNKMVNYAFRFIEILTSSRFENIYPFTSKEKEYLNKSKAFISSSLKSGNMPSKMQFLNNFLSTFNDFNFKKLHKSISSSSNILKKNLNQFSKRVSGQILSPKTLQQLFNEWLMEDFEPNGDILIIIGD